MKLLFFLFGALLSISAAHATVLTFGFTGNVNNDPFGAFDSAAFTGSFTFDSNTPQTLNTPNSGGFAGAGGIFSMSVYFTGTTGGALDSMLFSADMLNITVNNNFPGPLDEFLVTGASSTNSQLSIEITLDDFTGTALSNTQLPQSPPDLADFTARGFTLFAGSLDNPIEAEGVLATLSCTAGCAASSPVPLPGTGLLLGTGLAALGLAARGRRRLAWLSMFSAQHI